MACSSPRTSSSRLNKAAVNVHLSPLSYPYVVAAKQPPTTLGGVTRQARRKKARAAKKQGAGPNGPAPVLSPEGLPDDLHVAGQVEDRVPPAAAAVEPAPPMGLRLVSVTMFRARSRLRHLFSRRQSNPNESE